MSHTAKRIFHNTVWLFSAELSYGIGMFFVTVWMARYLGAAQFGKISFALSLTSLLAILVDFGLSTLMIREVARQHNLAGKYLSNILLMRITVGLFYILLILGITLYFGHDSAVAKLLILTGLALLINNISLTFIGIFRSHEKMQHEAIGKMIQTVGMLVLGSLFITARLSVVSFGWMYLLVYMMSAIYMYIIVGRKFIRVRLDFDWNFWKHLLVQSWPFALSLVFVSIYFYMDSVMLGFMKQQVQVGWYNADYKIIFFLQMFVGIIMGVLFPIMSRLYRESLESLRRVLVAGVKLLALLAVPVGFGGTVLARHIITLIYGSNYLGGALAFQILIWASVIVFLSSIYSQALLACDRQKTFVWGVGAGALVNIVLNLLLIPRYGLNGAACATVMAEITTSIFMYQHLQKIVVVPLWGIIMKPLIASLVMAIVLWLLRSFTALPLIGLGVAVYLAVMIIIGGIGRDEVQFIRDMVKQKQELSPLVSEQ